MNQIRQLSFSSGPIEYGWGTFTVTVDGEVFECEASNIGEHPVTALISTCCQLISYYQDPRNLPTFPNQILFEIAACTEPGGMLIAVEPEEDELLDFRVCDVRNSDEPWPSLKTLNHPLREVNGLISYRRLVDASFEAAVELLNQHGITGFNERWLGADWIQDDPKSLFPVGHFLYLCQFQGRFASLGRTASESSLHEEIQTLQNLATTAS